jgi:benzoate-CoA ligase family protein
MVDEYNLTTDLLDRHLQTDGGHREAARCDGRRVTYRELLELVGRVGNALRSSAVRAGDRVLVVLPDSIEFAAAYLGAIRIGAVAVPSNPGLRRAEFALFLRESAARVAIVHASALPEFPSAEGGPAPPPKLVLVGATTAPPVDWDRWMAESDPDCPAAVTSPQDPAFWLWTSGSTGHPRAAVHRHGDWRPCWEGYARGVLGIGPHDVCFSAAKAFHAYGLGNGTVFPLAAGARTIYLPSRPTPETIFDHLGQDRPTLFFAVPTMYAALLAQLDRVPGLELHELRYCVSAGEPLPGELFRRWHARFGVEILDGIGSTEMLHIYLSARPGRVRPGSTGSPVEGYAVRVVDEAGGDAPTGTLGDLWVRGPSLASGYGEGSKLRPLRRRGDWFVTGDKFFVDADGYYWYVGRADDMFKSRAEWVSPTEVEAALIEHPAVLESAVVGGTDENGLTRARAFVVVKPGISPSADLATELSDALRDRLPNYAQPAWIEFLSELPKSSTGKLLRYQLRGRPLGGGTERSDRPAVPPLGRVPLQRDR